ncbi:MAG TPA: Nramp family divalent metal transporter [Gaiellaceae bacterium]|nr:Nramp family divalent metal transporter [Gaiellaceae bacterium]
MTEQETPKQPLAVADPPVGPTVLDEAHIGDIKGALGTIRLDDVAPRRSWRGHLVALLAVMGPGLIVMVGDNDAGGVSTYAQAGQNYGTSLLWVLLLLIPVLIVNQEMVVRLGAVTRVGHARLILERFGRFWGAFSVIDLFVLNFLTIVTEFIGIAFALEYLGVTKYASVPVAAAVLILMTTTGSFQKWERMMFVFVAGNLLVVPLIVYSHPRWGSVAHDSFVPGIHGGLTSTSVLLIIAMVGTTVAPWQLFFQQSNVVDKRITTRWINYERADTVIGSFIVVSGAAILIVTAAFAFAGTSYAGNFKDALHVATGLGDTLGHTSGVLFALVLLNASIIGAGAITLATSYAFGDVFGVRHSLNRPPREAKFFYGTYGAIVALAAGIVLIPGTPLGIVTVTVQALAGVLLPSASVFLLLLCNDRDVLGPWVNKLWLNIVATVILGALLMLSGILMVTTVFPNVNVTLLLLVLAGLLVVGLATLGTIGVRGQEPPPETDGRESWTMKPIALLGRPPRSRIRTITMATMYGYLLLSVILLAVKAAKLAGV